MEKMEEIANKNPKAVKLLMFYIALNGGPKEDNSTVCYDFYDSQELYINVTKVMGETEGPEWAFWINEECYWPKDEEEPWRSRKEAQDQAFFKALELLEAKLTEDEHTPK